MDSPLELRTAILRFLPAAARVAKRRYDNDRDLPRREVRGFRHFPSAPSVPLTKLEVDWRAVASDSWPAVSSLPETGEFRNALEQGVEGRRHIDQLVGTTIFGASRLEFDYFAEAVLARLLTRASSFNPRQLILEEVAEEVVRFLSAETLPHRALAPLHNFTCETDPIRLTNDLQIIRITTQDWELVEPLASMDSVVRAGVEEFALEYAAEIPKLLGPLEPAVSLPDVDLEAILRLRSVVSALRLFKPGAVGISYYRWGPAAWTPIGFSMGHGFASGSRLLGSRYVLASKELDAFRTHLIGLDRVPSARPRFETGLRWFESSYERVKLEDRLIDLTIALEAIIGDSQGDLSYRLSMRAAVLLESDGTARLRVRDLVKKLYRLRSELVHGGHVDAALQKMKRFDDPSAFLMDCEALVRRSLIAFAARSGPSAEPNIVSELDERLLGHESTNDVSGSE